MKIISRKLKRVMTHPLVRDLNLEEAGSVRVHRAMIQDKRLLKWVYERWYRELMPSAEATRHLTGPMVEIGSGAGFLDQILPGVIRTDSVAHPYADRVLDATRMDYPDDHVRCIFMVNVLHHLEEPAQFLAEAERCLAPGGRLVLVEPHNSFFNRFLCGNVDHYEYLDGSVAEWKNVTRSRMLEANMALSWVILCRDREKFIQKFVKLDIRSVRYHTFLAYALSGGMTFRSFLPGAAAPLIGLAEGLTSPLMRWLGTCMTVVVEKK